MEGRAMSLSAVAIEATNKSRIYIFCSVAYDRRLVNEKLYDFPVRNFLVEICKNSV